MSTLVGRGTGQVDSEWVRFPGAGAVEGRTRPVRDTAGPQKARRRRVPGGPVSALGPVPVVFTAVETDVAAGIPRDLDVEDEIAGAAGRVTTQVALAMTVRPRRQAP